MYAIKTRLANGIKKILLTAHWLLFCPNNPCLPVKTIRKEVETGKLKDLLLRSHKYDENNMCEITRKRALIRPDFPVMVGVAVVRLANPLGTEAVFLFDESTDTKSLF